MAANLERDEFVYPSNLDDSDFEETVRSSPDVTSKFLILHLLYHLVQIQKLKLWRKMKITQMQMNQIHMDYKKLQFTIILVIMKMKKISRMVGIGLIYLTKKTLDLNTDLFLGSNSFFWTHA